MAEFTSTLADALILMRRMISRVHAAEDAARVAPDRPAERAPDPTVNTTRALGGLLIGAAFAALAPLFAPAQAQQPAIILALATAAFGAAHLAERARGPLVAEAGFAAALVGAACVPFAAGAHPLASALAAALIALITILREGRTPLALLAVPAFLVCARAATGAPFLRGVDALSEAAFVLSLVGFGAVLARQSRRPSRSHEIVAEALRATTVPLPRSLAGYRRGPSPWAPRALALHGVALALATFPLLDALGVADPGIAALGIGGMLGAILAWGILLDKRLHTRPLVATAAVALAFAAASFALLALGPALAAIILLLLGAALVWRADVIRGYMARGNAPQAPDPMPE